MAIGVIRVQRDVLANMLRAHGEDDLADQVGAVSDHCLERIGRLGAFYAWSEDAFALGFGMGGTRALALASIDVIENSSRELAHHHSPGEIAQGFSEKPDANESARELELRRRALERNLYGPES